MKCEICDTATATMWVEPNIPVILDSTFPYPAKQLVSCDDCGPQLGYKILAPLTKTLGITEATNHTRDDWRVEAIEARDADR